MRMQALACRNTVLQLRQALGGRPEEFSLLAELAEHLRGKLDECLRQSPQYVDVLKTMSLEKLRDEFRLHVSLLSETLEGELRDDVIDKLYGEIAQRLESLPVVPVGGLLVSRTGWADVPAGAAGGSMSGALAWGIVRTIL